jgi:prephenate dehydratase
MKAAYLGPKASFSHQAALEIFLNTNVQAEALHTFTDIFEGVQSSRYEYGVVPFENSSNGSVVQVLDLLADRQAEFIAVNVCAEHYLSVHHQLLVKQSETDTSRRPGLEQTLKRVKKIYTHPQAWGQCSAFLSRAECRSIVRQDSSSTSEAASVVSRNEPSTFAAISSELAREEYGLFNIAANIEDEGDNTTRFFVIARQGTDLSSIQSHQHHDCGKLQLSKTLVSFTIDHDLPGALADTLSIFRRHHFNLTSINTRPSRSTPWNYIFFAECEQISQQGESGAVESLLQDLDAVALSCRQLGTWSDQSRR